MTTYAVRFWNMVVDLVFGIRLILVRAAIQTN